MKITYQIDDEGLLFVNPYGSEKKGPYIPVGFLPAEVLADLERIIQEVQSTSRKSKK
jgi:hypothetical protein